MRGTDGVRLVSYNIQYSRGRDGRYDIERIAREVETADVIALQEVERHWARSGDVDQPARLAELLAPRDWVYGPGVDLAARAGRDPGPAGRRQFGNMLLARSPILATRNHLLPKYASTGPMSLQRSALEAVVATRAGPLRLYSVHLTHLSAATRMPQVQRVIEIHRQAVWEGAAIAAGSPKQDWIDDGLPPPMPSEAVLLGDFNMEPDSSEYEAIVGPCSDYGGRITHPQGFLDAWVAAGHGIDEGHTSDVNGRPARLDYCFVSTALGSRLGAVWIDTEASGSDHLPLWVEMDL